MPSYNLETSPIIIDTDPGVDDALALALAFLSPELDVRAITLTHGNADMQCVKRNAVTILDAIAAHRKAINLPKAIPILAIGCDAPIDGQTPVTATYFHGKDGLAGIHDGQVYQTPLNWEEQLLHTTEKRKDVLPINTPTFYTTHRDAADEILFQLKNSDPLTLTLCAIGPLTNFAVAYRRDPVTFSRARRIISMGGAIDAPGNESPHAEFNYRSDPKAADVVMESSKGFEHSPSGYASRLKLIDQGKVAPIHIVVVPLDAGDVGFITHEQYEKYILALGTSTPMAAFCNGFVGVTFKKCKDLFNLDDFVM
ncbi:Inosine/uridine-preferring nucleoside hydrolase domain-containing protein [Spinellus fusiger]|nr:Inosine/uridine-preferring nucleoside hydrolase domain-containing protein [Spinellus fusiger]